MKKSVFLLFFLCCALLSSAKRPGNADQTKYSTQNDISYILPSDTDAYRRERCKLDVYMPTKTIGCPVVVWFHGGGLEGGGKYIPELLKNKGIGVVAVNYRLSPKAQHPAYIDDAAEAVAWVMHNIGRFGGDASKVFVSGHSAGGYLSLMLAMDKRYLAEYGVDADSIRGYIPVSGQTVTHFTIRKELGLPFDIPVVDEFAPIHYARKSTAPITLITGDRNLEMANRWEENAWFMSVMRNVGNSQVRLFELQGFDHGTVHDAALTMVADIAVKALKQ